jgi:hypothetical protein
MTLAVAKFLAVSFWILGIAGLVASLWFFVLPAVPPWYARYRAWLVKKASGQ